MTKKLEIKEKNSILPKDSEFLTRWSPRAFDENFQLKTQDLKLCLEAARWSYSANNSQPWRFVYGFKNDPIFQQILEILPHFNQIWAKNASAFVMVFSESKNKNLNFFGCGAACMSFSLQAQKLGLITHLMAGLDKEKYEKLCDENWLPVCVIAVGKMGNGENLDEFNQARETPNGRKNLDEIAFNSFDNLKNI